MLEDMQLRGLSPRTQAVYVRSVRRLADFYGKSPDLISEPELRDYVMELNAGKLVQPSTAKLQLCGIKFFFRNTLQRRWPSLALMRSPKARRLPVVLSREEVWRILEAVRYPVYRVCLTTIYSCGLRVTHHHPEPLPHPHKPPALPQKPRPNSKPFQRFTTGLSPSRFLPWLRRPRLLDTTLTPASFARQKP
jgi:hypothetical protein